jgi:exosortase
VGRAPAHVIAGRPIEPAVSRPRWRQALIPTALFALILGALYGSVLAVMVQQWWDDPNFSHGFAVPLFAGFLIWRHRAALSAVPWQGSAVGLPVVVAGLLILFLAEIGAELFLARSSLLVVLAGLTLFHLGWGVLRLVAFPLAFLILMIPLPVIAFNAIALPLQHFAATNAAAALDLFGVPVLLEGNVIQLSHLTLGVGEACSGIRSLMSLVALAVAWAYLTLPTAGAMAILVLAAVPITIVANGARIVITGLVGEWFGPRYAQGLFHEFSGWLIFVVAVAGLLATHAAIMLVWRRRRPRTTP